MDVVALPRRQRQHVRRSGNTGVEGRHLVVHGAAGTIGTSEVGFPPGGVQRGPRTGQAAGRPLIIAGLLVAHATEIAM